jgi:hypothetical protein
LIVAISALSATDNVGVTGYLVNESSTKPSAGAAGWSASAPSSYFFSSAGTKTLYAWAKDAANNVSNSRSATVTVTITTPPPPPPPGSGSLISPATGGLYWDNANWGLGIGTASPDQFVHVKYDQNDITALRVENLDIAGASSPLAQEQFVLGPAGQEHLMLQVLSDTHPTMPEVALMNAYTHNLFFRTNAVNVLKIFRAGAAEDTLVLDQGSVGIGTDVPSQKLEVNGGVKMNTADVRPACGAATRGTFWFTRDDAAGDSADVCARVSGSYAWRKLF